MVQSTSRGPICLGSHPGSPTARAAKGRQAQRWAGQRSWPWCRPAHSSVNRRRCPRGRWEAPGTSASPQTGSEHRNRVRNTVLFPFRFPLPLSPKSHCGKPPLLSFRAQPAEGKGRRARFPKLLLGGRPGASREAGVISPLYVGRDAGGGSPAEVPVSRRWGWDLNPQGQGLKGGSAPPHAHSSAPTPKF